MTVESPYNREETLLGMLEKIRSEVERGGLVHRLDRGTSGLLIVAKDGETQVKLRAEFKARKIRKEYLALVKGEINEPFEIEAPVRRNRGGASAMRADYRGKAALTYGEIEKHFNGYTLLRIRIVTGRRHQIRAHLAFIGHPIVGDVDYGGSKELNRPFLHATRLEFEHPRIGKRLVQNSALPQELEEFIGKLD
jgi:23S rRNA pseudouridine1911/1915/1917 synthase